MSRLFFGAVLSAVGILYLWLAYQSIAPGLQSGDWVSFLGAALFLAAGIAATVAGVNLVRPKRR